MMPAPFREAEIDLDALAANLEHLRDADRDGAPLLVDVGAEAWGHGIDVVVPALAAMAIGGFVVARIDEARSIRALASGATIVTTQHAPDEDFAAAAAARITPAVRSVDEYRRAADAGVDGVMLTRENGAGLPGLDARALEAIRSDARLRHVAAVEDGAFRILGPELFGVSEDDRDPGSALRPVMRLWAPVTATKHVGAGEGVSYGYTHRTATAGVLALVTLGYGDGLSRAAGNTAPVAISDRMLPIAGRVAMDAFMLDLGDVAAPPRGTPVTVLGDGARGEPTAHEHATALRTHSAEITTRITARPRRHPRDDR